MATKLGVNVNVDFTGVTYTSGSGWSGTPAWTFDTPNLVVHKGHNKITWTLTTLNSNQQNSVPAGYTAAFADGTSGVVFKPSNPTPWTGSTPTKQSNGTIKCDDNFHNIPETEIFNYTTTVELTPNTGTNGQLGTFQFDPDVENASGDGGQLTHSVEEHEVAGV
jgi:hypothetical protein